VAVLTTGDDAQIPYRLKKDGKTFTIGGGATAKAVLTTLDRLTVISAVVTINLLATGSDLAASLLIVEFTEIESAAITQLGEALLELQLDDGGKLTWTRQITVRNGNIP